MRTIGYFLALLLAGASVSSRAAAVQFFGVTIGKRYLQTSTAAAALRAAEGFEAQAFVYSTVSASASVRKPNNQVQQLAPFNGGAQVRSLFNSQAALNGAWPPGNYVLNMTNATDGAKSSTMNLAGDFFPPQARVSNFTEAQTISALSPFTLTWDALGRPATDFVYVRIEADGAIAFETARIPGAPGALNGLSTGVTIPAGRLQEGRVYDCSVFVWRAIARDTTTIPGAAGQTAYTAETTLPIRTRFNVQDVRFYGVEKSVNYTQTVSQAVLVTSPFETSSFAQGFAADSIAAASFSSPAQVSRNLASDGVNHSFSQSFATQGAMETAFGPGNYGFRLQTKNNGVRTNTLVFNSNAYPAGPPQIANIDEAQYVKSSQPFTLSWTLTDSTASDLIQVAITDGTNVVIATPQTPGVAGALNGAARSFTVPAGMLQAGRNYTGMVRCFRIVANDAVTYPLAIGVAGYSRITRFPIRVAAGPSPRPTIATPLRVGNQTELSFDSIRGEKYSIHGSTQLPNWTQIETVTASGSSTVIRLPSSPAPFTFYRVLVGP